MTSVVVNGIIFLDYGKVVFKINRWTNNEVDILKEYYCTNERFKVYELIPNRTPESIRRKASSLGFSDKRKNYDKRTFNRNYFDELDSHTKAYWLGFIYADGYVEKNNLLGFKLKKDDLSHLNKFCSEINFSGKAKIESTIFKGSNYEFSRLTICGKEITKSLNLLGVHPNKTKTIKFPEIDSGMIKHFIRGYFDGDGSIGIYNDRGYKKYLFSIVSGSKDFIYSIKSHLDYYAKCDLKIREINGAYEIRCQNIKGIKNLLNEIYCESTIENRLDRKYEIYKRYKEII